MVERTVKSTEPTPQSAKIKSLEGLRGVMAWWVVLRHTALSFAWPIPLMDHALAIDVFILLSGFVIARLIDRKIVHYGQFVFRRAFRLFPPYLVALLLSTILLPIQLAAWKSIPDDNASRITLAEQALGNLPPHLLSHAVMLHGAIPEAWLPGTAYTIIGQAWSLSLEWQFNLVAPFLLWALMGRRRWPLIVAAVFALHYFSRYFSDAFLGSKILLFCIGMCCHLALERRNERAIWAALAVVLGALSVYWTGLFQVIPLLIWATVLVAAVTAASFQPSRWLTNVLGSKVATHFGEMSYALYLFHMIPLYCSIFVLARLGATGRTLEAGVLFATLIGAYVLARTALLVVEKPARTLGTRWTERRTPVATRATGEVLPLVDSRR